MVSPSPIYSKYGHFCLQEVRFVSFVVFHDDMRDLHSGNTQISYFLRSRRALRCVFDAWIYDIPTQSISYTCVYTICSRHTEALSTSSASNALCGISYETPETLDMRSEHKPPQPSKKSQLILPLQPRVSCLHPLPAVSLMIYLMRHLGGLSLTPRPYELTGGGRGGHHINFPTCPSIAA